MTNSTKQSLPLATIWKKSFIEEMAQPNFKKMRNLKYLSLVQLKMWVDL